MITNTNGPHFFGIYNQNPITQCAGHLRTAVLRCRVFVLNTVSFMVVKDPGSARLLLQALQAIGDAAVLLLGTNQSLKPGAAPHLVQALGDGNLYFCSADPHPDLELGAHGRWLLAQKRPPFGMGDLAEASAWGLAGPATILASALDKALLFDSSDESWQLLLWLQLTSTGMKVQPMAGAWTFQDALPTLNQMLEQERLRGTMLRRLKEAGAPGLFKVPAPITDRQADVPQALAEAAVALDAVPLAPLAMTQVSGLPAADLVRVLAQASLVRVMALAYAEGWNGKIGVAAPWVRKQVKRIAVVYPIYGGSLNLAQRSAQALERLGYEVSRIDPSRHASEVARVQKNARESDLLIQRIEQECLRDIAMAKPQALWILAQAPLGLDALHKLRRQGLLTAFWFCEDYRVRKGWKDLATTVDAFFPMQGGAFLPALRAAGATEVAVLPMAAASDACVPIQADDHQRGLSFFGAPYANRVSFFEALTDLPLELYGEGWDRAATPLLKPLVKDAARLTEAQGFDLFRACAININLHSSPFHRGIDHEGDYVNPRAFEIAACGAFQLVDRRRDLAAAFVPGQEIETFGSAEELREQIVRWTADPKGRRLVADGGQRRVKAEHTYERRLAVVCKTLGLSPIAP